MYHCYLTLLIEHENVTVKSRGQFLSQNLKHFWFPDLILSVSGMALGLTRLWSSWKVLHQEQSWRQSHSSPVRMPQFVLSIQITTFSSYKTKPNLQVKAKKIVCITSKLLLFNIFFFASSPVLRFIPRIPPTTAPNQMPSQQKVTLIADIEIQILFHLSIQKT